MGIVERFIERLGAQDWQGFAETLADEGFERVGPFGEVTPNKASYVKFLSEATSRLPGYRITVKRVAYAGAMAVAELSEAFELGGRQVELPEAWIFDIGEDGLIHRVAIYQEWPDRLEEAIRGGGAGPPE